MQTPEDHHWSNTSPFAKSSATEILLGILSVTFMISGILVAAADLSTGFSVFVSGVVMLGLFKLIQLASEAVRILKDRP